MAPEAPAHRFSLRTALLLLGGCAVHFAVGCFTGLTVDEAHYALYAVHLDLSYFDHPPLVGWVQWPLVTLDAPVGVLRLVPEALWLVTALLVHATAVRLAAAPDAPGDRPLAGVPAAAAEAAGFWAVACLVLAPLLHVLAIGLVPDTLLMAFTAAILWQLTGMLDRRIAPTPGQWLALGLLLGLAGLSKYTAVFAAAAAAGCLLAAHGWRLLLRPGPWLAVLVAAALVTPVFVWNAGHDWISFTYQLRHGMGGEWRVSRVAVYVLVQVLVYGPLSALGFLLACRAPRRWWWTARGGLVTFFLLPFLLFAGFAGGGSSLPHWSAPAWVALAPFAGLGLARAASAGAPGAIRVLVAGQAALCIAGLAVLLAGGLPWVSRDDPLGQKNPVAGVYGWDLAGARARQLAAERHLPGLVVQNWTLASRLGWYARPLPVRVLDARFDQYDLWFGALPRGADALLVDWSQMAYRPPVGEGGFASCTPVDALAVARLGRLIAGFEFEDCRNWQGGRLPVRRR